MAPILFHGDDKMREIINVEKEDEVIEMKVVHLFFNSTRYVYFQ